MITLLSERFAPITSCIGFLELPLGDSADALIHWRRKLYSRVRVAQSDTTFPEVLHKLEPLVAGARPRELLVEMSSEWTAYFDCGLHGTDAPSTIGFLSNLTRRHGLVIVNTPHARDSRGVVVRYGSTQFQLFGPEGTPPLNYVRTVYLSNDGGHWVFGTSGTTLPFENEQAYTAPRKRDRFSSAMLQQYCLALGVDAFNVDAYGPSSVLVESRVKMPARRWIMSLTKTQQYLDIVPGLADASPG